MSDEYDATVRHAIYVERYKSRLANEIVDLVNGVSNGLYREITASDLDTLTRRQLNRLLKDVQAYIRQGYLPIQEAVLSAANDFAQYEAEWQGRMMVSTGVTATLGIPSDADLWAAVNARPFEGKLLAEWVEGLAPNTVRRVSEVITQGFTDGLSPLEAARQIRGTKNVKGVMDISKNGARSLARTAIAHTSNVAKEQAMKPLRGVRGVMWVSVLDHRTTQICRVRSGQFYPKGEGPRPPAHVGCRSTVLPYTERNRDRLKDIETYPEWLRRQSAQVQDDILGPTRGKLYREGGYSVDRFSDPSGKTYTLDELRDRDESTFRDVFGE